MSFVQSVKHAGRHVRCFGQDALADVCFADRDHFFGCGRRSHHNHPVILALDAARQAKDRLSEVVEVEVSLPARGGGEVVYRVTRAQFDAMIAPLLERTGRACKRALRDAG